VNRCDKACGLHVRRSISKTCGAARGAPKAANPRKLISIRLPEDVIERWRATGPGWQTRMADRLAKAPPK
jgi:uncharacterized protein (DUF4415 family)